MAVTCVVGLAQGDRVYLGADSAGVSDWSLTIRADEKVFVNGPFVIGFTSSYRMGQLLRYKFRAPELPQSSQIDLMSYMVCEFVDAVRQCFKDGGLAKKESEVESGGQFLVGVRGKLFEINSDYQVGRNAARFAAIGCGAQVALGALYATEDLGPVNRLCIALKAAEQFNIGVRGPFSFAEVRSE